MGCFSGIKLDVDNLEFATDFASRRSNPSNIDGKFFISIIKGGVAGTLFLEGSANNPVTGDFAVTGHASGDLYTFVYSIDGVRIFDRKTSHSTEVFDSGSVYFYTDTDGDTNMVTVGKFTTEGFFWQASPKYHRRDEFTRLRPNAYSIYNPYSTVNISNSWYFGGSSTISKWSSDRSSISWIKNFSGSNGSFQYTNQLGSNVVFVGSNDGFGATDQSGSAEYSLNVLCYNTSNPPTLQWSGHWGQQDSTNSYYISGTNSLRPQNHAIDSQSNLYIGVRTNVDQINAYRPTILKINSSGQQQWQRKLLTTDSVWNDQMYIYGVSVFSDDSICIAGRVRNTNGSDWRGFVGRITSDGSQITWIRSIEYAPGGSSIGILISSVSVDKFDHVWISGTGYNTSNNLQEPFIMRVPGDGSGTLNSSIWSYDDISSVMSLSTLYPMSNFTGSIPATGTTNSTHSFNGLSIITSGGFSANPRPDVWNADHVKIYSSADGGKTSLKYNSTNIVKENPLIIKAGQFDTTGIVDDTMYLSSYEWATINEPITLTGDFALEMWIKVSSFNTNNGGSTHVASGSSSYFYIDSTGNVGIYASGVVYITNDTPISTNTWHHVVWRRTGTDCKVYVDTETNPTLTGTSSNTFNISEFCKNYNTSTNLGASYYSLNGYISNIRIYKDRSLSEAEIQKNYDALKLRFGI